MNKNSLEIKQSLATVIKDAVTGLFGNSHKVEQLFVRNYIDRPADMSRGDYATGVALHGSRIFGLTPVETAIKIVAKLNYDIETGTSQIASVVKKIEVAGPGFINFYIKDSVLDGAILEATKTDAKYIKGISTINTAYGSTSINFGKKLAYEYTDPNPFKVFHIGHLMANTVGESLSRLGEFTGGDIRRFCYQGDIGRHVALFVYGLRLMDKPFPTSEEGGKMPLVERMYYMGTSYAKGATYFKEHPEVEDEVQTINRKLYDKSDEEINQIYDLGLEWSLQYFETLYDMLGTKFDQYFFESVCVEPARVLIAEGLTKGVFVESDGAIVFEGEKFQDESKGEKLHTRVFITKVGLPTYDAKELGLAKLKYEAFNYDKGLVVTANEQDQYFKVNLKVQSLMLPELSGKNEHVSHGMMILPTGKMSSRTGDVVSAEEMLESARNHALQIMTDREMNDDEKIAVASQVAVAGIKYAILRQSSGKDVVYEASKAMSFDGDSGPYLQYACVRANSILKKGNEAGLQPKIFTLSDFIQEKNEDEEILFLCKKVFIFPEIIERSFLDNSPHHIATYLVELSGMFNAFYAHTKIIDATDEQTKVRSAALLSLTQAVHNVLSNGLYILGIQVPAKM